MPNSILKTIYAQLTALFSALDRGGDYAQNLVDDYHNIVNRLENEFPSLYRWGDFRVPSTARYSSISGPIYYEGDLVRVKIQQLIAVIKSLVKDSPGSENNVPTTAETHLRDIKEFQTLLTKIERVKTLPKAFLERIENSLGIRPLVLIGAVAAGLSVLHWFIR